MTRIEATSMLIDHADTPGRFDEARLAAAAFLARNSGSALDAYRHDFSASSSYAHSSRWPCRWRRRPRHDRR